MADALTEIFRAASKHPNSRVSKLIHQVEEEPSQKNIVLLLIELSEHAEYSVDFNVPLKYYLDLFERCGINNELVLNEAGLLLVNSSKIYSKRVDYVQSLVERQILTLSNADDELQKQRLDQEQIENAAPAEKPKRGRKRALEAPSDPYEVELAPKKFKKLTEEKRFASPKAVTKIKTMSRNIEVEQHIHPAGWQHATIYDLDNEEDVDTKRNYKLFTFHVEHRYNTLVPDINFRLHFKVKDYMDEQEEMEEDEACNTDRSWPPLSEAYVQKYLRLENYVLGQDIKANKRKSTDQAAHQATCAKIVNIQSVNESQQPLKICNTTDLINSEKTSELESKTTDSSVKQSSTNLDLNSANKEHDNSESLATNNDSGLNESIFNEFDNSLESTQPNCSQASGNLSEINNSTIHTENDSALGSSFLEQNSTKNSESLNTTTENDSTLKTNVEDSTSENTNFFDRTVEGTSDPDVEENGETSCDSSKNDTSLHAGVTNDKSGTIDINDTNDLSETQQSQEASLCNTVDVNNEVLNTLSEEGENLKQLYIEELAKATESRKDSALNDDRPHSNSRETFKSGETSSIDVIAEQDKNSTQIQAHLPSADDEGVCLSDLDDHDCRLLSPIIKTTNILPGVERKDITIVMDDELREALEMRDGIIKHFGYETFALPVTAEPRKQNLIFNILQLPEKLVRRKILFKLGPDMDLYLQARCLKRARAEPVAREGRNYQLLKWFSLNNTDMSDICITPPPSPDHVSEFYGFSDDEDDAISAIDFYGFTEEEQLILNTKSINRLSRDSGVGVDVNNLTPDKESLEIIFAPESNSALNKSKRAVNSNEMETETETTENILEQLSDDIRNALSLELQETSEGKKEASNDVNSNTTLTANNSQEKDILDTQLTDFGLDSTTCINTEETDDFLPPNNTEESAKNSENCSLTQSQESDAVLMENSTEILTSAEHSLINSEHSTAAEPQEKSSERINTETQSSTEALSSAEIDVPCNESSSLQQSNKSAEDLVRKEFGSENRTDEPSNGMNDADDVGIILDMGAQGTKTKIQQWHEHLQPILAKSRERHHFDIYKLGTEIIDTVQSKTTATANSFGEFPNSSTASFDFIMEDKEKSYVSRYFLSTLLLANQSNIEISIQNKSSEKPSAWHDINLKLLSTKRHTVAIEDNIGMIDSKQKTKALNIKQNTKEVQKGRAINHQNVGEENDEDEPLIKQQSAASGLKTPVKRSSNEYATSSCVAEKKPKKNLFTTLTKSRHTILPDLEQSRVQISQPPPFVASNAHNSVQASTTHQAQHKNLPFFNVNMNAIRTLQPIEKVLKRSDDHDSGIFSVDEISTS